VHRYLSEVALDDIEELEREVVEHGREHANARGKEIVEHGRGDRGHQAMAVVTSASEMPGATTARLALPVPPMASKAFMIPQTVPKRPMNGVTVAVVARKLKRRSSRVCSAVAARAKARERDSRLRTVGRAPGVPCAMLRTCC